MTPTNPVESFGAAVYPLNAICTSVMYLKYQSIPGRVVSMLAPAGSRHERGNQGGRPIFELARSRINGLASLLRRAQLAAALAKRRFVRVDRSEAPRDINDNYEKFAPALLRSLSWSMIDQIECSGNKEMIVTGTVKSFNYSKGYGFIRMDSDGGDVFVHLSAVREAGLSNLRRGQKLGFEIFENGGKAAAKNLRIDDAVTRASEQELVSVKNGVIQDNARCQMKLTRAKPLAVKRTPISRAALELAIANAVRDSDPQCNALIGIIIERAVPKAAGGANWVVKGIKFGKADRDRCRAAIATCMNEGQREFELSD